MTTSRQIMLACTNASGVADIFCCTVNYTDQPQSAALDAQHAQNRALAAGYSGPFVCFDEAAQSNIGRKVQQLKQPIPITLHDPVSGGAAHGGLVMNDTGFNVQMNGYSNCGVEDNCGMVALMEYLEGEIRLWAYNDINSEEPSHSVSFENARNERRWLEGEYVSVWEDGEKVHRFCFIDPDSLAITSICGTDKHYQHLEYEYVELELGGEKMSLNAEERQLTEESKNTLRAALGQ